MICDNDSPTVMQYCFGGCDDVIVARVNKVMRSMILHTLTYLDQFFCPSFDICYLGRNKQLKYDLKVNNHPIVYSKQQIDE